jgi:ketosteroid isomerase-like protein
MAFTEADIRTTVAEWYRALDRHDELTEVLPYLVDDALEMRFPEATARGHAGFRDWYKAVTNRFFDEVHTLSSVDFTELAADRATVTVVVNWQARIWNPPAPRSQWLGFDAYQTWVLVPGPDGRPQVRTYIVDRLVPMPGSASL